MTRRLLAVLGILATTFVLAAHAQDRFPAKVDPRGARDVKRSDDKTDPKILIEDAATEQERLKRQFDEFKQKLLVLAQRMENSTKPEDREKAKTLREAIKKASEEGVETRFSTLIERLRANGTFNNPEALNDVLMENQNLRAVLRDIMELLLKDDRDKQLKEEKERAQRLLDELKNIIGQQERNKEKTDLGKTKSSDLAKTEAKIRERTDNIINPKSNKGNEAKNGEGKGSKSGKEGVGEGKNDTKEAKADGKEGKDGEGKDGKSGEGKDGKSGEGKDSKSGEGKDGKSGEGKDSKSGEGKEGKGGEGKEGKGGEGKDGKSGEGKDGKGGEGKDGKSGEGKDGKGGEGKDGKPGDGKDGKGGEGKDGKPGEGKEGKPGAGKPSEKPGEGKNGKPSGGKPGDGKPGDGKPGDGKSGDSKGKGEGKGDSKGGSGKSGQSGQGKQGEGKGGQSGQSGQSGQQGQQGEGKSGGKGGQQQQQPSPEQSQIKKQIQDVEKYQERAEEKLRKDNRKDASEDEQAAVDGLNRARQQLEDLLRQLREEEIERLLARLEARCRRMLAMQIAVRDDTVALDKVIKTNPDGKPTRGDQGASNVLSDREEEIVKEARAGLKLLEEEGSAVAFAEVFTQVKGDMELVAERLRKTDTGVVTVTVENQIIETLQEMSEALKKAQAENKNKSKPGQPGQSGQQGDQKLLDLLAELKMIRSMQKRVNSRTDLYGKQYAGEQAPLPDVGGSSEEREKYERIQRELKDLSKRQEKISKVTHDIATGKNEQK